jgi:hypothetical protein
LAASNVHFAATSAHLAKMLIDPLLAIFERLKRRCTPAAKRDAEDQPTKYKSHPADDQRKSHRVHIISLKG